MSFPLGIAWVYERTISFHSSTFPVICFSPKFRFGDAAPLAWNEEGSSPKIVLFYMVSLRGVRILFWGGYFLFDLYTRVDMSQMSNRTIYLHELDLPGFEYL